MKNTVNTTGTIAGALASLKNEFENKTTVERIMEFNASTIHRSFVKMTANGNPDVGSTTNAGLNCNLISLKPKAARKALMKIFNINEYEVRKNKGKEYVGLQSKLADKLGYNTADKKVYVTNINESMVDDLMLEMKTCDLFDPENIRKIFKDVDAMYRMYQELIIDAAKKATIVKIKFALTNDRAMCLQKFAKSYDYDKNELKIEKFFPEMYEFFNDDLNMMQSSVVNYIKDVITVIREAGKGMPETEANRLRSFMGIGPSEALVGIAKFAYSKIIAEHRKALENHYNSLSVLADDNNDKEDDIVKQKKKIRNARIDMLANFTRQLLVGFSDEEKASIVQFCAKTDKSGELDVKSSNMMATSLLKEEYLTMITAQSEVKVCGYKLLKNKGLQVGDVVEFTNGISANGSLLDFKDELVFASGEFEIQEFSGALYATKPLEFKAPEVDMTKRLFCVRSSKNKAAVNKAIKGLSGDENKIITVDEFGKIKLDNIVIGEVKTTDEKEFDRLLSVKGWVSHLMVVEDKDYNTFIMFELSDVIQIERETEIEVDDSDLFNDEEVEVDDEEVEVEDSPDVEDDIIDELFDEEFDI